ncbi:glycosyltransferase [Mucilaginibacter sp. OK098]|uniref:glycosyltransferase n=1 Tax=Mucilaginibacter sp. OK098 TaxID=1855297 RepID=UPI000918321B|nr:glycosyltransferase [Mucilaginibacter sp. OK098]SHN13263.1 Glycosyltransferase involved in cell wall bisynthesis [Mucilaginibacter sp. OK098]
MSEMKVSAMVVGRNEGAKLETCLKSLFFCDEILYGDLDSGDDSVEIAKKYNCKIYKFKTFGPAGEYTQAKLIEYVKNDWVITIDPDEVLSDILITEIKQTLITIDSNPKIGSISVPWQFYFGKKKLKGTVWGYAKWKEILVNKHRFDFLPVTHYGRKLKLGFEGFFIPNTGNNVLHHYWMDNLKSFIGKHRKYLKDEGRDRYNLGQRTSLLHITGSFFYQFIYCFINKRGYKDGLVGFFLSLFWTWYCTCSNISLYLITLKSNRDKNTA